MRQGRKAGSEMKCCLPTLFMLLLRRKRRMLSTSCVIGVTSGPEGGVTVSMTNKLIVKTCLSFITVF